MTPVSERMSRLTSRELNRTIHDQTIMNIARYGATNPDALSHRLYVLDREVDIDRAFMVRASVLGLIGVGLAMLWSPYWLILTAVALGCMLLQGATGWCPPINFLRRMGYRSVAETDYERYALKAIRGDFQRLPAISEHQELGRIEELLEMMKH